MSLAITDFTDKVAVVTGGANGIGLAMAERFLAEGAKVVIADIDAEALATAEQALNAGDRLLTLNCDISTLENNQRLAADTIERFGKVNILCLNAALLGEVDGWRASDVGPEGWRKTLDTNLDAHYYGVHAFMPYLREQAEARIVFTSSSFALMSGLGDPAPYFVAQSGLMAWAECLYWDLLGRPDNRVGLSIILAGNTQTGPYFFLKEELARTADSPEEWDSGTWGSRDYIAALIEHFTNTGTPCDVVVQGMIDGIREDRFYLTPNMDVHWPHIDHRMATIRAQGNPSFFEKTLCVYRDLDADPTET